MMKTESQKLGDKAIRFLGSLKEQRHVDMPDFRSIEDIVEAMELCEEHDVPYDGLDDVEDFIERLKMHFTKLSCKESKKKWIEKSMLTVSKEDHNKRQKLISFMMDMLEILQKQGPGMSLRRDSQFLNEQLKTEGTSSDLEHDCKLRTQHLENGECLMIVAGETSAGKSSFLNLLFEEDLLPVHNNSSTSVITIVRYHSHKHARVVYKGNQPDKVFDLDQDGLEQLHSIAFMRSASEREFHEVKEVQVYLPLTLLQGGLVLVDTPGIGENEFLENELINFIANNHIHGFVYIIKTDNAGGVQEDRLLNLLRIVIQNQNKAANQTCGRKFDPKSALFVCNRFDLVAKDELEKVKKNAIDKLMSCWPCFDPSQVVFFSSGRARRDITADIGYISDNYKELLESLRSLYNSALETRIKSSYKWIEKILKRTTHHLRTMVRRLDSSDIHLAEKCSKVSEKLNKLHKHSDKVIEEVAHQLESEHNNLHTTLLKFVKTPHCKLKLTTDWCSDELPRPDSGLGDWLWIKSKITDVFHDRLMTLLDEWDHEEGYISKMEDGIACRIKLDLDFLEAELQEVEEELQSETSSDSVDSPNALSISQRRVYSPRRTSVGKFRVHLEEPKMPIKLGGRIIKPITSILSAVKNARKVGDYKSNPVNVAVECSKDIYEGLIHEKGRLDGDLHSVVDFLLDRPREYVAAIERKIPDMILSNQLMLNRLQKNLADEREHFKEYEEMMTQSEALRRSLMEYGEGYILVEDFAKNELRITKTDKEGDCISVPFNVTDFLMNSSSDLEMTRRRDMRGLWTVLYAGQLLRKGVESNVTIRVYLPSSGVDFTYKEVAKLRCLTWQYTNIAEFLGIHNAGSKIPAIVYDGGLRSVRKLLGTFCSKREFVPMIIEGTASGIEYLHRKGLVHMELSQDTVTVDENGMVLLTGACLPRKATLPEDIESTEIGNFVYLPPEVLRGETYDYNSDIYSLGLLILEMTTVDASTVFKDQRHMTFCDFVKNVDPDKMMKLDELISVFTVKSRALIQNCLEVDKNYRPIMSEVVEYASYIKSEDEALSKLTNRRSRAIKRPSLSVSIKM